MRYEKKPRYNYVWSIPDAACAFLSLLWLLSAFVIACIGQIKWHVLLTLTCSYWKTMVRTTTISPWVEFGLRFIGMWPNSAYPNLYWTSYMILLVVLLYFQYLYVTMHFDAHNLSLLMDCLGLSLANTLATLKLVMLRWNRR